MHSVTITEFLEARIAEDEAALSRYTNPECEGWEVSYSDGLYGVNGLMTISDGRVHAECAAKRAIIALADRVESLDYALMDARGGFADLGSGILEALAAAYKNHPDYQQEWTA